MLDEHNLYETYLDKDSIYLGTGFYKLDNILYTISIYENEWEIDKEFRLANGTLQFVTGIYFSSLPEEVQKAAVRDMNILKQKKKEKHGR